MHTTSNGVAIVPDIYALISNCTFLDMHSDKANPAVVAVFREGCVYNFTKCTFSKCSGFLAGALFLQQYLQGLNLDRCIFLNNQAQAEDLPEKGNDIYLYHEDPSEDEKILDKKIVHCISSSKNKRIGYYWNPSGDEYDKLLLNLE
ncbi:MAG: hypothetical protein EZS28_046722 [Streblomastix strix]|uniref:Uncharacterized protein n=1 Tax=Streblomastix strix TaxID=222440 RepID=A0A5J4TJQ2_9EUKA|nr:MAG: hypothetical protein EZS28_046722 [Streblomastix strix]